MLFRSIDSSDVPWPVDDDAHGVVDAPSEQEVGQFAAEPAGEGAEGADADADADADTAADEDDESDTLMVDVPILEEKKKPRRKSTKQDIPTDDIAEKLAPFTYRDERSGRVRFKSNLFSI